MAARGSPLSPTQARLIARALRAIEAAWRGADTAQIHSPGLSADLFRLRMSALPHEELHACWLDAAHRLLAVETLFRGTLTETAVYPREVVKSALRHNAAAAIIAHNHPSGLAVPSATDIDLTLSLRTALELVGVRLLDHIIIAGDKSMSFAEKGLL